MPIFDLVLWRTQNFGSGKMGMTNYRRERIDRTSALSARRTESEETLGGETTGNARSHHW